MKVSDMKERATSDHTWLRNPLSVLLQLFSLSIHFNSCFSNIKIVTTGLFFGALLFFNLYYKMIYIYSGLSMSVRLTDATQTIYDYCQYAVDLFFVYKYGTHFYQEYYKQYTIFDQITRTVNNNAISTRITKLVLSFILLWSSSSLMDFSAWASIYGWTIPSVFSVVYIYILLKILTNLDFTYQTMHIEVRLQGISDLIQSYYEGCSLLPGDPVEKKNWFYSKCCTVKARKSEKWSESRRYEMRWLSQCYLILTEQSAFINQMFGFRILLNSLSLLIDIIRFANLAVRLVMGAQQKLEYFAAAATILRLLACVIILTSLVHHCEMVYRQIEGILCISDNLLINKNPDPEIRKAVTQLRDLVQCRPISFHMAYFIRLDYSMLLSIASVVVTYTIILLQSLN